MAKNPHRGVISDATWAAVEARRARPDKEKWDEMVRDGVIDEQGNVLISMPIFEPGEHLEPIVEDLERDWAGEWRAEQARRREAGE